MKDKNWFRVFIRILETLFCSIVPSAACLYILIKAPNVTLWKVLCAVAFILCAAANGFLWYWDNINVKHNAKRFFVVNGAAYIIFIIAGYVIQKFTPVEIYTVCFTSLRAFEEIFDLRVSYSMNLSHAIMIVEMILVYFIGYRSFLKSQAPEVDIDPV